MVCLPVRWHRDEGTWVHFFYYNISGARMVAAGRARDVLYLLTLGGNVVCRTSGDVDDALLYRACAGFPLLLAARRRAGQAIWWQRILKTRLFSRNVALFLRYSTGRRQAATLNASRPLLRGDSTYSPISGRQRYLAAALRVQQDVCAAGRQRRFDESRVRMLLNK